jgi:hypothetical protein
MVHKPEIEIPETVVIPEEVIHTYDDERLVSNHDKKILAEDDEDDRDSLEIRAAKKRWKDLNPNETLIIIMWSGLSRMDLPMSKEWYKHIKFGEYSCCKTDGIGYWINSGGMSGSWKNSKIAQDIFNNVYKITDPVDYCLKNLRYFIMMESYLKTRGYKFLFTSFINYWHTTHSYNRLIHSEPNIGYHCKDYPIFQRFDFNNWFFINDRQDTICEFAMTHGPRGDVHPSDKMHQKFAEEIVLPRVQQIHM